MAYYSRYRSVLIQLRDNAENEEKDGWRRVNLPTAFSELSKSGMEGRSWCAHLATLKRLGYYRPSEDKDKGIWGYVRSMDHTRRKSIP